MADGSYGKREIYIDLTVAGARVIQPATVQLKITSIRIKGTSAGDIILREDLASTGPIVFKLGVAAGAVDGTINFGEGKGARIVRGLFMDALAGAWAAGDHMIIYLA